MTSTDRTPWQIGFRGVPPPAAFNMARYAIGAAAPDKLALIVVHDAASTDHARWTYAQIEDAVLRVAAALHDRGIEPASRIMIRMENTPEYAILFFAAIAGGFVPIPASSALTRSEAQFILEDSRSATIALAATLPIEHLPNGVLLLEAEEIERMIRHARRADYAATLADDPGYLIYTSGTTSKPKGVLHAHRAAWGRRPMYQGWYGLTSADRMMHAGAFNWTYTLGTGLTDPWANGATSIVYTGEKSPELWPRLIRSTEATIFAGVPSLYRQILKYGAVDRGALPSMRHGLIAGEAPPPGLIETWKDVAGTDLYEAFGMSEMSTYLSSSPSVPRRVGRIGKAQPGRSVVILPQDGGSDPLPPGEQGLIAVHRSDPGLMLGYWHRPDEEREVMRGDWFVGGDIGDMDAEGYIAHRGRANDLMKALGYRVAPQEVEEVLAKVPGVIEVACCEVPVREDLSVIGAVLVCGENRPRIEALDAHAAQALAPYKRPRAYVFVDALPRTANGKLRRNALPALARERLPTSRD